MTSSLTTYQGDYYQIYPDYIFTTSGYVTQVHSYTCIIISKPQMKLGQCTEVQPFKFHCICFLFYITHSVTFFIVRKPLLFIQHFSGHQPHCPKSRTSCNFHFMGTSYISFIHTSSEFALRYQ